MAKTITISDTQAELLLSLINNDNLIDDGYPEEEISEIREVGRIIKAAPNE